MKQDTLELAEEFDLAAWMERESIAFRNSYGGSGLQLNVQTCPGCNDRRYRVYLNAETGAGNCFVCNETYSKFKFVHIALQHDPESKKDWAATFQHVKDFLKEQGWRPKRTATVAVELEKAAFPTSFALPNMAGQNLVYLEERGVNGELAKYFHLRFCMEGWWKFKKPDGEQGYQKFDNRLIIPVFDLDGTFVTYQGRDVTGLVTDKKYLFPSGLPGTGRFLLNGQNALRAKRVCMGEGFFDVAACKIAFDEEVSLRDVVPIGSFGKHLSSGSPDGNDQLGRLLKLKAQGLEELTIMWDGEHKALMAALDAGKLTTGIGLKTRIAVLPFEKDPNEVDARVVREAFWAAKPWSPSLAIEWSLRSPIRK